MPARELAHHIWEIKESLRGVYDDSEVEDVILPFTLLRRLDCVLDEYREVIMNELKKEQEDERRAYLLKVLMKKYNLSFFNSSGLSLKKLLGNPDLIGDNFKTYLDGFTENVRDILSNFVYEDSTSDTVDLSRLYTRLNKHNKLFAVTQKFVNIDLNPDKVDNAMMGTIFEIVIRHSKEATNTQAGQYYTPREVVRLLVALTLSGKEETLHEPGRIFSIYDPCCGTGGMLTEGKNHLREVSRNPSLRVNLYGQEWNEKTYAICKSDMLIKGELQDADEHIKLGNTLTNDLFLGKRYNFMLANPPFGLDWKDEYSKVKEENCTDGRFEAGLPDKSDGSLLFLLHMISKMETRGGGSRIGIVFNGSPLFNGQAGSGWSNIRKMLLDKNLLDAIIALPKNLFYGTDIGTYLWILDNNRSEEKRGKVLFVDATYPEFISPLKRSLGKKRFEISEQGIEEILNIYKAYSTEKRVVTNEEVGEKEERFIAKLLDYEDLLYTTVTVLRPYRYWYSDLCTKIQELVDNKTIDLSKKKFEVFAQLLEVEGLEQKRGDGELFNHLKKSKKVDLKVANINLIRTHLAEVAEDAPEVREKPLKSDSPLLSNNDLKDMESIPMKEDIDAYFHREVLPYLPDAWMDRSKDKVGCEFPVTKIFYQYRPLRSIEEILEDIKALEVDTDLTLEQFIHSL